MKREETLLQQALAAARAKRELTARDLFLEVVQIDPRNELAWLWLTGLLDDLDDCIYACERVLEINPDNAKARQYLARLQEQKQTQRMEQRQALEKQVQRAIELARAGQRETALGIIRDAVQKPEPGPEAWRLLAALSRDQAEQIDALQKYLALSPQDAKARASLDRLLHLKRNPRELAAIYEEQGQIDKAIEQYYLALMQPQFKEQWRDIDREIVRLKRHRSQNLAHVSPGVSIARLTAGPSLLYVFMLLIHVGINPLADPEPILWLEFPGTLLGGFLIAFASIRSHHRIWSLLFKDVSTGGTPRARARMATAGWLLVVLPFLHLFYAAFHRLVNFLLTP